MFIAKYENKIRWSVKLNNCSKGEINILSFRDKVKSSRAEKIRDNEVGVEIIAISIHCTQNKAKLICVVLTCCMLATDRTMQ